MDAIKKKMQAMKVEKDNACDRSDVCEEASKVAKSPASLEDICVMAYLKYLENEIVTYISLTQSKSHLVKGVAKKMLQV